MAGRPLRTIFNAKGNLTRRISIPTSPLWWFVVLLGILCLSNYSKIVVRVVRGHDLADEAFDYVKVDRAATDEVPRDTHPVNAADSETQDHPNLSHRRNLPDDDDDFDYSQPKRSSDEELGHKTIRIIGTKKEPSIGDVQDEQLAPPLQRFQLEIVVALTAVFVITQFFYGKGANFMLAQRWLQNTKPVLESQFQMLGYGDAYMQCQSWNAFEFYATGRQNCHYMKALVEARPRQCPWAFWITKLLFNQTDAVTIDIRLDNVDTFVVGIGKRKELKKLQDCNALLKETSVLRRVPDLPSSLCVLSDSADVVERLLTPEVVKVLKSEAKGLGRILIGDKIISDPTSTAPEANGMPGIGVTFAIIPDEQDMKTTVKLIELVIYRLIDLASFVKLSDKARNETKKNRLNFEKKIFRENETEREEILETKRQKKKQEEEARHENMTDSQQRKWDEKQYKKTVRARQPKIKVIRN